MGVGMSAFTVGEIAIGQNFIDFTEHNGEWLEVVQVVGAGNVINLMSLESEQIGSGYLVRDAVGDEFIVRAYQLLKKPLADDMAAWTEVLDLIDRVKSPKWVGA